MLPSEFFWWCHLELNQGHQDFQSCALPTELWHLLNFRRAKIIQKCFLQKYHVVFYTFAARPGAMEYFQYQLKNGIQLVHLPVASEIAWCGMMIHTGSRDEDPDQHGLAHFLEHVLFKGTDTRKPFHILSRMEDVGGEINAYTTKEETCIYASFLKGDHPRAMELISDILMHSTFPKKEIDREKEVIIDEINSYKDAPGELIFDDFEELIYPDHPIGRNILGTSESLRSFNKESLRGFMKTRYHTDQMVFCSVGNIRFNLLLRYFKKYFGGIPSNPRKTERLKARQSEALHTEVDKQTWQTHCIIGTTAYDLHHKHRLGLYLLNNILGGQGLNSRLNLSLREKNGYAYNVESSYNPYVDTGVLSIYFGTDNENLSKSLKLAHSELKKLRIKKLGSLQLARAQRQMTGQVARSREHHENLLFTLGKSILLFNRVDSMAEIKKKIESVSSDDLLEIANDILAPERLSMLIFK